MWRTRRERPGVAGGLLLALAVVIGPAGAGEPRDKTNPNPPASTTAQPGGKTNPNPADGKTNPKSSDKTNTTNPISVGDKTNPTRPPGTTTRSAAKPVAPLDDGPMVMSTDAYRKALGKPAPSMSMTYNREPDWQEVPAWRQTSFFGLRAEGQLFIYVVDCSGSMDDGDRLDRAKRELRRSIAGLQFPQRFKVIFYNDRAIPMPGALPKPADRESKDQLSRWLNMVAPDGDTDPRAALSLAVAFKPDAVFLLSDGAFPEGTVDAVARLNPGKVPIHGVDLSGGAAGDDLRRIAEQSGGRYVARGN